MMIARMNPRDPIIAMDRILNACARPSLADAAVYTYAKGGSDVSGPSIRLAEAMAQVWGNMQFGIRELDQANGESTVQAYAWDVETNTRREITFQVPHLRYTRKGSYKLEDPREIYELVANQGARRLRACILAVIPGDVTEAAVAQCEATMRTRANASPEAMQKMVAAFESFSVTKEQIEKRIQRRLDAIQPAQVVSLKKIYASLRDGMSNPADWFEGTEAEPTPQTTTSSRTNSVKAKAREQREAAQKTSGANQQDNTPHHLEQDGQQQSLGITFTQVSDQLHRASDIDLLDAAADLIGEVTDSAHREELNYIYHLRRAELEQV
ncbi:hypothetical protein BGZ81_011714 [Podila clonocystis]|nr:hypothetical protein BGZ81_011714 [Podila clonocystis]